MIYQYMICLSEENGVPMPQLWEKAERSFPTEAGDLQGGSIRTWTLGPGFKVRRRIHFFRE